MKQLDQLLKHFGWRREVVDADAFVESQLQKPATFKTVEEREAAAAAREAAKDGDLVTKTISSGHNRAVEVVTRIIRRVQQKLSVTNYLTLVVVTAVILASITAGAYAFQVQYRNSLKDAWAIIFLEAERSGTKIANGLASVPYPPEVVLANRPEATGEIFRKPDFAYFIKSDRLATVVFGRQSLKDLRAKDIGVSSLRFQQSWNVIIMDGRSYLLSRVGVEQAKRYIRGDLTPGDYLFGWRFDLSKLISASERPTDYDNTVYLVSRGDQLLYTSDSGITHDNVQERPLVQSYTKSDLGLGELEFTNERHESYYGFFFEIPSTNIVMFRETSKRQALESVYELAKKFALVLLIILTISVLLLQFPIRNITRPINELVALASEISKGNFSINLKAKGFGEIITLTSSFASMAANLVHRDRAIQTLMQEQNAKVRMEREFAVAKSVQDNLFPRTMLTTDSGLVLTSAYYPAAQVAGDWFTYDYTESTGETVVVIVDVSGHDMAASMFTAILAGLFFEIRGSNPTRFPTEEFGIKAARLVRHFGIGRWHATMQVVRYVKDEQVFEIMNCGHTFPLLVSEPGSGRKSKTVRLPSSPVGLEGGYAGIIKQIPFEAGDTLLLYTDGVTETRRPDGRVWGEKRLFQVAVGCAGQSAFEMINTVYQECERFRGNKANQDDLCLIALRKSA